jgi:prephenate dehydrogenase
VRVALLGVGLIGGSIGLAARRRAGAHVVGYDPDAGVLESAARLGVIDEQASDISAAVSAADFVFVAVPVGATVKTALLALESVGPACIVSDVGSTKQAIVEAIEDRRFVGGHPLAGAETAGVEQAREDLFDGAVWYLTPAAAAVGSGQSSSTVSPDDEHDAALRRIGELIDKLGAHTVAIDPGAHDRLMASVSHLPHVLANVLVAQALSTVESIDEPLATKGPRPIAGPSFRDATRVAGANTSIWTDIYLSNHEALVGAIDEAIERLQSVRSVLFEGDGQALAAWNERARTEREQLLGAGLARDS